MSIATLSPTLTGLTPREAITDTLHRALLALDTNDIVLFNSAYTQTATVEFIGRHTYVGLPSIRDELFASVAPMDTTHHVSNVRIELDGEDKASMTAYVLAQHARPGEGLMPKGEKYLAGAQYWIELVREGALWKVEYWKMRIVWTQGDESVMKQGE